MDLRYQQEELDRFIDGLQAGELPEIDAIDDAELADLCALVAEMRGQPEIEWPGIEFPVVAVARLSRDLQGSPANAPANQAYYDDLPATMSNGHLPLPAPLRDGVPAHPLTVGRTRAAWLSQWGQMAAAAVVLVLFASLLAVVLNNQAGDDDTSSGFAPTTVGNDPTLATDAPPAIVLRTTGAEQAGGNGSYCWGFCEYPVGVALPAQSLDVHRGESVQLDFAQPGAPVRAMYGLFAYDQAVEMIDGQPWITTPAEFSTISSMKQLPSAVFVDLPIEVDPGHYVLVVTADYDASGQQRLVQGFNLMVLGSGAATVTASPVATPVDLSTWRALQTAAGFDLFAPTWLPEGLSLASPEPPMSLPSFTSAQLVYEYEGMKVLRITEASPFEAGPDTMPSEQWSGSVEQEIGAKQVRVYESDTQVIAWWQEGDTSITVEATHEGSDNSGLPEPRVDVLRIVESMVPVGYGESESPVTPPDAALTVEEHAVGRAREMVLSLGGNQDATLTQSRLTTLSEVVALGLPMSEQADPASPVWSVEFSDAFLPESCPEAGASVCSNGQAVIVLDAVNGEMLSWHGADGQWQTASPNQAALSPPDSEAPAAGTCAPLQGDLVTITIHPEIPSPRCSFNGGDQRLQVVNDTDQAIDVVIAQFTAMIPPGRSHMFDTPFGSYLAPGVHVIQTSIYTNGSGAELWLRE